MKECKHEKVCQECVKEEIAVLEERIESLKKKIPEDKSDVFKKIFKDFEERNKKEYITLPYPVYCQPNHLYPNYTTWPVYTSSTTFTLE